jgi:hypothetical protein
MRHVGWWTVASSWMFQKTRPRRLRISPVRPRCGPETMMRMRCPIKKGAEGGVVGGGSTEGGAEEGGAEAAGVEPVD